MNQIADHQTVPRGAPHTEAEKRLQDSIARLVAWVEAHGYKVIEAAHGLEALQVCRDHKTRIDLMVTDLGMPQLGGRELAAQAMPLRQDMRVLFMSGYTEDAVVQHGTLAKDMAFIQNPFTPATLCAKVREVLDRA